MLKCSDFLGGVIDPMARHIDEQICLLATVCSVQESLAVNASVPSSVASTANAEGFWYCIGGVWLSSTSTVGKECVAEAARTPPRLPARNRSLVTFLDTK